MLRFGIPAILAAIAGAALLGVVSVMEPWFTWHLAGREAVVTPVKLVMGLLMLFFAVFELLPRFRQLRFGDRHLVLGGVLSGFFGGLSGHQGALRAAFLAKAGLDTRGFVGTSAVIGLMVDLTRIVAYFGMLAALGNRLELGRELAPLVAVGCVAAFVGVLVGKRFLDKVTIEAIQTLTGVLLFAIGLGLASGLI